MIAATRHAKHTGFTLVEILVVLLLVGLAVGILSLSVGGDSRPWERTRALELLADRLSLASREAQASGQRWGVVLVPNSAVSGSDGWQLHFEVLTSEGWAPAAERIDSVFADAPLPAGVTPVLTVEGRLLNLQERREQPPIQLFESGEATPFVLRLQAPGDSQALAGSSLGRFALMDCGADCEAAL